jgi:AcrR family transcriptional regulator
MLGRMTASYPRADGRSARGERTRAAVATALLALLESGSLQPTAAEIAERAGVSLRSVFQHFEDMETLYAAVAQAQMQRLSGYISQEKAAGPVAERTCALVERRAELLEMISPVRRAALLREPFSAELARRLRGAHDMAREEIELTFAPELARAREPEILACALDVATNWPAWDTSRRMNRLSIDDSKRVMQRAIRALIAEPGLDTADDRRDIADGDQSDA